MFIILKWSTQEGMKYDLYFGLSANPSLYKSDLDTMEVKPVILELNKKYYWKIVEKKWKGNQNFKNFHR